MDEGVIIQQWVTIETSEMMESKHFKIKVEQLTMHLEHQESVVQAVVVLVINL